MLRTLLAAIAGVAVWGIGVTLLNLGLRHGWADYAAVEKAMTFTTAMMAARLCMSGASSLAGGYIASLISRENRNAALGSAVVLLVLFAPYHLSIWAKFPIWYHLIFFASLLFLPLIGARFAPRR
ncbi:MAG TPA: hypothetical protein VGF56_04650 [Rhizomicrobium sp.]|jgi:hypothetical protein